MTSEKVRSYQPTLGRMRSAVDIRTATQPLSLGGVVEGAVEKKPRTSDRDVAESVAVSADVSDSPNDVTQRHRRRRLRTSKMLSRHHADGRLSSDIAAEVDNTVSSVACAPCNEGEGDLLVCTKQTSKSTSASKPKKLSKKLGLVILGKPSRTIQHITDEKTTKKDATVDLKMEDTVVEEVREGHVVTLEEPSTTVANTVTSSAISKRHRTRMRRRSGKLPTTNHRSNRHLKMDKRKNWLRKQNRLLRKKRAAEKRKPCQRRRVEEQQKKAAEARKAQSAKKVSACMKDKLSKRREQEECNQVWNQADKIATVIHQTFVLELPDKPITVKVTSKDHPPALAKCEKHLPKGEFATTVNVVSEKCSAEPRASTATLSGTGIYAHCSPRTANTATNRPKNRQPPTTILLSQNEFQPTSVDQETCAPYDNWLSMKSCQTAASRCQDDQALSRHDAAENDLIRQVVRRRVEDIAAGKSRVCIGTRISNSETTEAFPRVTRTHLNATFGNSNSNQEGQAITDDYDARSHTKRTGHALHVTALHGNARTMRRY